MVNQYCAHSFARNWQLPFLNQWKGQNDHRKYFMIKSPQKNVANLVGDEPATSWSPVGRAPNWAKAGSIWFYPQFQIRGAICILFFLFLHKNICNGYTLEVPQWDASNEYPLHMTCNAQKRPLRNLWTMQALISLRICAGWSGPSLSAYRINGYNG